MAIKHCTPTVYTVYFFEHDSSVFCKMKVNLECVDGPDVICVITLYF